MSTDTMKTNSAFDAWVTDVVERMGGQRREPQMQMIQHIVNAIESNEPVIIEAPTGTGKSLGYALPAIFAARTAGKRVLIVTRTKKLQDQLAKDLPRYIDAALMDNAHKIRWSTLKGRNHFTCKKRITAADAAIPITLAAWATAEGGSRDEAPDHLDKDWRAVSGGQDCIGKKCPFYDMCPGTMQRKESGESHIVIANQTLLAMQVAFDVEAIPGDFDIVIIDEAQHFEKTVREQLSNDLSPADLVKATFADAADLVESMIPEKGYVFHKGVTPGSQLWKAYAHCVAQKKALEEELEENDNMDLEDKKMLNLLTKIVRALYAFTKPDENILWVDQDGLHSSPIDIKQLIRDALGNTAAVFTSATIPDDFGLEREIINIGGGFTNAGLYISNISGAGKYEFRKDAAEETLELVQAIGGRSLLLYTSEQAMMDMYFWLRTRVAVNVMHQKMPDSINRFREDETSVLLGIETCWEGIDIPGPSLSLVVIDRLPFPNMGDPIYTSDVERNGWFQASVPSTKTLFRQGVGRLLRSHDDVGIVAVLDERLKTKGYGKVLTNSIQTQYIPSKAQAVQFLKQIRAEIEKS